MTTKADKVIQANAASAKARSRADHSRAAALCREAGLSTRARHHDAASRGDSNPEGINQYSGAAGAASRASERAESKTSTANSRRGTPSSKEREGAASKAHAAAAAAHTAAAKVAPGPREQGEHERAAERHQIMSNIHGTRSRPSSGTFTSGPRK